MSALYLITAIAGRAVAMPSECVDSVVDLGAIVPVPAAPAHVRGLAALRSRVVTVIDAAIALGADNGPCTGRAVVITAGGHLYALLVDRLDDVAPFAVAPLPDGVRLDPAWARAARGVIDRDGEAVLVIDPTALINGGAESPRTIAA